MFSKGIWFIFGNSKNENMYYSFTYLLVYYRDFSKQQIFGYCTIKILMSNININYSWVFFQASIKYFSRIACERAKIYIVKFNLGNEI